MYKSSFPSVRHLNSNEESMYIHDQVREEGTRAPVTAIISSNHAVAPRHVKALDPYLSTHPRGRFYYYPHFTEKETKFQ